MRNLGDLGPCQATDIYGSDDDYGGDGTTRVVCGKPGRLISELGTRGGRRRRFVCPQHGLALALVNQDRCYIHDDCRSNHELGQRCLAAQLRTLCGVDG